MNAVATLSRFEIKRTLRNRRVMFFSILYPVLLFAMVGKSASGDVPGTHVAYETYFLISYTSFGVIAATLTNNSMRISQERKDGWIRQLRLSAAPSYGYVTSKIVTSLIVVLPAIVITFGLGAAMGVKLDSGEWIAAFLALWFGSLAFTAIGIAIGYGVPQDSVQLVSMIVFLGGAVLGGQLFPVSGVLENIGKALPTYWMREIAQDTVTKVPVPIEGVLILAAWVLACGGLAAVMYSKRSED